MKPKKVKLKKPRGLITTNKQGELEIVSRKTGKKTNQKGAFGQKSIFPRSDARISNRMKTAIYREELKK